MAIIKGYFEEFHFPECKIEKFEFIGDNLIVNIKSELAVYPPHPLADKHKFLDHCKVEFKKLNIHGKRLMSMMKKQENTTKKSKNLLQSSVQGLHLILSMKGILLRGFCSIPKKDG
jgi:hypothetical protein